MRMTMDHDRNFGGGALERMRETTALASPPG
jgi:hypothetical protein